MSRKKLTTTEHHGATIPCPICRHDLSASSNMTGDAEANEGAITICLYCRGVLILECRSPLMVRPAKPEDYADQADDVERVQRVIELFMRSEGRA